MKKLFSILVVFTYIIFVSGCKKEDEASPTARNMVQGKWKNIELSWQYFDEANNLVYEKPYQEDYPGEKFEFNKDSLWITAPEFVSWAGTVRANTYKFYKSNGQERLYVEDGKSIAEFKAFTDYRVELLSKNEMWIAIDTQEQGIESVQYPDLNDDGVLKTARKYVQTFKFIRD